MKFQKSFLNSLEPKNQQFSSLKTRIQEKTSVLDSFMAQNKIQKDNQFQHFQKEQTKKKENINNSIQNLEKKSFLEKSFHDKQDLNKSEQILSFLQEKPFIQKTPEDKVVELKKQNQQFDQQIQRNSTIQKRNHSVSISQKNHHTPPQAIQPHQPVNGRSFLDKFLDAEKQIKELQKNQTKILNFHQKQEDPELTLKTQKPEKSEKSEIILNFHQKTQKQPTEYRFQTVLHTQQLLKQISLSFEEHLYYISEAKKHVQFNRDHFLVTYQSLLYANALRPPLFTPLNLPYKSNKKLLVLDLDETLVHCNQNNEQSQVVIPAKTGQGVFFKARMNIRPYCHSFLREMSKLYEIIIFTASSPNYANAVINYLDPQKKYISHRLYREQCHLTQESYFIKDLRILQRDLRDIVLVDNLAYSFAFQLDNGIPILSYYDNDLDCELVSLGEYLKAIHALEDLREGNKAFFKFYQYRHYTDIESIFTDLYKDVK